MVSRTPYWLGIWLFILAAFLHLTWNEINAQQRIGGPYEPDSATVLLMHFDGDYQNEVEATADARPHGEVSFVEGDSAGKFGRQLRLDNSSRLNRSHLQVPDTTSLDLTGSWTMESWVKIRSFVDTELRSEAGILFKPGHPQEAAYWQSNYSVGIFEGARDFLTGYYNPQIESQVFFRSPQHLFEFNEWYHVTFIRDTSSQIIVQIIHQPTGNKEYLPGVKSDSLELLHLEAYNYGQAGEGGSPQVSDQPLFIGSSPQNDTASHSLDGQLDEIRISNTVRSFQIPPLITNVTELGKQSTTETYEIEASIQTLGDQEVASATLHYQADGNGWKQEPMVESGENRYGVTIPSQPVGTTVEYWVEARSEDGRRSIDPRGTTQDSSFYSFGVWEEHMTVLDLDFDQGDDVPRDQSEIGAELTLHGTAQSATYAEGDHPNTDDLAMVFDSKDKTWLETSSVFHQLTSFVVDFKFFARDSVPPEATRVLAKGKASAPYMSNFQVYMEDGKAKPAVYASDNDFNPCGSFTGSCLKLTDHPIEADTWYRVHFGIRSPEATASDTGAIFSRLIHNATLDTLAERIHRTESGAHPNTASLKIGGMGDATDFPYFDGRIDDIRIMNHVPDRYLPDSLKQTSIEDPTDLPNRITLGDNYPNPFNPTTQIEFSLPQASDVNLIVYDVLGRRVATLVDGKRQGGKHSVSFDANNLSSGVYIYRLKADGFSKSRKMLLLK